MISNKNIYSILLAGTIFVSACTVGPDYQKPEVNAPPEFVLQNILTELNTTESKPLPTQWWTGFNDPVLNDLVQNGLQNNLEIQASLARVEQAKAQVRLAGADNNLQLDASANARLEEERNLDGDNDDTTSSSASATLGAVLPLDIFGRTRRSVEAARAALEYAKADLNGTLLRISTDITSEYLTLRGNQRQLELLDESITLQEKTLSIVRTRFETGLAPELDMQRAIRSVENLRASRAPLKEDLQNNRNLLATLTGEFPGIFEESLQDKSTIPTYSDTIPSTLPLTILKSRPDILQAEANLKEAVALIGVAEADFYPSLSLAGDIGIGFTGLDGSSATEMVVAAISALINQTITDGGARTARRDAAVAQAQEQLAVYEQILRDAVREVETTLAAIRSSLESQTSLEKVVKASQRSFHQAEILYQQGLISFLDVVDAQRSLADAEQSLARARTNYAVQIARLFEVFGTKVEK